MTTEQQKPAQPAETWGELTRTLNNIEMALMAVAAAAPPNWQRPLAAYKDGWVKGIGAYEVKVDQHGPTVIFWMGHHYTRRSASNPKSFAAAIWFSRPIGKGEDGFSIFARLITFEDDVDHNAEPLPAYVAEKLQ